MPTTTTIEIRKQYLHFSAAHFTIFSATERERLHGHNWRIAALLTGPVREDGLCFDYAIYKEVLRRLCQRFDEYTLLPSLSPYLTISEDDVYYYVQHDNSRMVFLKADTLLLPVRNITIEELAAYLLGEMLADRQTLDQHGVTKLRMEVSSGPDQWAYSEWQRGD